MKHHVSQISILNLWSWISGSDIAINLKTCFSNVKTPFPTICQSEKKKCATSAYCAKLTLMKNYRIGLKIKCCRKASGWTQSNNNNHYNNPVFYKGFGCSQLGPVIAFHSLVRHVQTKVEFRLAIQ